MNLRQRNTALNDAVDAAEHRRRLMRYALGAEPAVLFVLVVCIVGLQSARFVTSDNAVQIMAQAAPTVVVAVGMTFVLLTAGVDLSAGALMFVGAGLAGQLAVAGWPLGLAAGVMVAVGVAGGFVNSVLVTRLGLIPFVATLSMLYIGRGLGRWITETRAINLPEPFLVLGASSWLGVPTVAWVAAAVAVAGQLVLSFTPFGRQLYALGANKEAARKVGVNTARLTAVVYIISGACAGLGGLLALAQLGRSRPALGSSTSSTRSPRPSSAGRASTAGVGVCCRERSSVRCS